MDARIHTRDDRPRKKNTPKYDKPNKELPHSLNIMYTKSPILTLGASRAKRMPTKKGNPVLLWRLKGSLTRASLSSIIDGADLSISGPQLADKL